MGGFFNGSIDGVRIYNRALSAAEVNTLLSADGGAPPSTTTLSGSPNPSTPGTSVTFTATVTGSAPTGTVAFTDGGNAICSGVALAAGSASSKTATCSTSGLTAGTHSIIASYSGDSGNTSSSGSVSQLVQATASGPVGWWKFDEGSGTAAADASGNSNNATLVNGPVWTTGESNSGLAFNGSNSYVSVPYSASLNATSAVTLSAWIKTTSPARGDIVSRFSGAPYPGYALVASGNCAAGQVGMWVGDNAGGYVCSAGTINNGSWHLVTGTYDGTTVRVYIDGALSNSGSRTNGLNNPSNGPTIGAYSLSGAMGGFFNGSIDGVRIYNRALSAAEVNTLLSGG
jgi:hypothetical protein